MWLGDPNEVELDGPEEAREELRRRAHLAIGAGLKQGRDLRHLRVCVRDDQGAIVFHGTMAEAAACDADALTLPAVSRDQAAIAQAKWLRSQAREATILARARVSQLGMTMAALAAEQARARQTLMESQAKRDANGLGVFAT